MDNKVPKWLTSAICISYGCAGLVALGWMSLKVDDMSAPIAVVFPPGMEADETFSQIVQANGSPIRYGSSGNIIIAQFDDISFEEIKEQTNALFIMNPIAAGACFISEET